MTTPAALVLAPASVESLNMTAPYGLTGLGVFSVKDYGALGDGVTDDASSIQEAISDLAAGGVLYFPPGIYLVSSPLTVPADRVTFQGAGRGLSVIKKFADTILIDASGQHPTTTTTVRRLGVSIRDLTLDGGDNASWTQPLVRAYYSARNLYQNLEFQANYGCAFQCVEHWDSNFTNCRFISTGGTDGTKPAMNILQSDGAVSGMGHSTDNCNNLWFVNSTFETFRDGAVWMIGGNGQRINKCYFVNTKMENSKTRGPFIKVQTAAFIKFTNLDTISSGFDSGVSTPVDIFNVASCLDLCVSGYKGESGGSTTTVRTYLRLAGSNTMATLMGLAFNGGASNSPSVAAIELTGTNNLVSLLSYGWAFNPASATLISGSPSSFSTSQIA